jgi:hypothetical protein
MKRYCALVIAMCVVLTCYGWADQKGDKADKFAVELAKVEFKRKDKYEYQAILTLKEPLPKDLNKATIRFLFVKADSGLTPQSATEIDAAGPTEMRAAFPWSSVGGLLTKSGKYVGFVLDLTPLKEWPSSAPKMIEAPLDASTLLEGMDVRLEEGKGQLYVAFVEYGKDGDSKVSVSNTISVKAAEEAKAQPQTAQAQVIGKANVTADQAPVMQGRETVLTAKKGDTFDVIAINGDWYGVLPSRGWLHKTNVYYDPITPAAVPPPTKIEPAPATAVPPAAEPTVKTPTATSVAPAAQPATARPSKESPAGAQFPTWSLGEVSVSKKYGLWNNTSPFEENMGAARFTVKPDAGEELLSVRFSISALAADREAVAKLAARREALATTVPIFGDLLLIDPKQREALTGAYRMFDMQDLVLIIQNIERSPRWVVEPAVHGYFVGSGNVSTGGWECSAPWHLARRTSTSFTGLLEVAKPATIILLFSVPKGSDIKAALLRIVGQDSVPVKVSDNNGEVRK